MVENLFWSLVVVLGLTPVVVVLGLAPVVVVKKGNIVVVVFNSAVFKMSKTDQKL